MSMAFMPVPLAKIGPIVEPHGLSFLTMKSWIGTLPFSAKIRRIDVETRSVMYRWLKFVLITTPLLT
jgi:hypothetical protein